MDGIVRQLKAPFMVNMPSLSLADAQAVKISEIIILNYSLRLPAVRAHRLAQLGDEQREWRQQLYRQAQVSPELVPLALVRVEGTGTA
jgi:hypothetical protein